jgi:hypothetical protein
MQKINNYLIIFIAIFSFMFVCPVKAKSSMLILRYDVTGNTANEPSPSETNTSSKECSPFGKTTDPNDFAYYLQTIFNIMKFAAPVMVLVFTIIDLLKTVASGKDEDFKKVWNKALKRFGYAVIIFFLPDLINYVFSLLGLYGTCGIS